ncbi:MAG: hypothetical protein GKR95_07360 [Gammaproteobacteria bacterium]|nr:hypothetical protein [Gammaproteobacteria bacterium]
MKSNNPLSDLIEHLTRSNPISENLAHKLVHEVTTYFDENIEQFVQRRHFELQEAGFKNSQIFTLIEDEITQMRFPATRLSHRQLRRLVYG